jgi:predicted PurR-regulated permease PerM
MSPFTTRRSRAQLLILVLGAGVALALAPYVSGLRGVLVLLVTHRYGAALALVVIGGGIASNIDNVVRPIYCRISNIHPLTTLVGAFVGVSLFGLVGLLLGPLTISYFFELVQVYEREYGHAEKLTAPPHTEGARLENSSPGSLARVDAR